MTNKDTMLTMLMSSDARSNKIADDFTQNEPVYFAPKTELNQ